MKTVVSLLVLGLVLASAPLARASDGRVAARLSGYNEVHFIPAPTPALRGAVSTAARGKFEARIDDRGDMIHYELEYEGLTGDVTQAHIHFGQRHTVGGIVVWLCQTSAQPAPPAVAALTPECPGPTAGRVTGTITPTQVLDVAGQGIAAGEFEELVAAIRAGRTYANVHSAAFGPGEIRGQVYRDHRRDR
jgi:hypothetical protein